MSFIIIIIIPRKWNLWHSEDKPSCHTSHFLTRKEGVWPNLLLRSALDQQGKSLHWPVSHTTQLIMVSESYSFQELFPTPPLISKWKAAPEKQRAKNTVQWSYLGPITLTTGSTYMYCSYTFTKSSLLFPSSKCILLKPYTFTNMGGGYLICMRRQIILTFWLVLAYDLWQFIKW